MLHQQLMAHGLSVQKFQQNLAQQSHVSKITFQKCQKTSLHNIRNLGTALDEGNNEIYHVRNLDLNILKLVSKSW